MTHKRQKRIRKQRGATDRRAALASHVDEKNLDSGPLALVKATPPWAGADGEWLGSDSWGPTLRELRDAEVGRAALERLRKEFSPRWSLSATEHPVRWDYVFLRLRLALLEMGHVLKTVRCGRITDRLRDPKGYPGVRAELRAGALLLEAGAALTHEPKLERPGGPDWHAQWREGSAYIEVKLSRTSRETGTRENCGGLFTMRFLEALDADARGVQESIWATLRLSAGTLDEMGWGGVVHEPLLRPRARHAAAAFALLLRTRRHLGPIRGRFSLAGGCEVIVRPRPDRQAGLVVDGSFVVGDDDSVSLRLSDDLSEAAGQLERAPGNRVILLDASGDSALQQPVTAVRPLLERESWAKNIAVVMIVHRNHPHCVVRLVRGRASDSMETMRLIEGKLRRCEHGHLHADPLVAPTTPCDF